MHELVWVCVSIFICTCVWMCIIMTCDKISSTNTTINVTFNKPKINNTKYSLGWAVKPNHFCWTTVTKVTVLKSPKNAAFVIN